MFPEEERVKYSAMTGQSLYYLGETNLKHKILAIVEEEGAEKASYALKLLQSRRGTDHRQHRQGPDHRPHGDAGIPRRRSGHDLPDDHGGRDRRGASEPLPDPDRGRDPRADRAHPRPAAQGADARRTASPKKRQKDLLRVLRNAQRLLQPLAVVNPYADELTFTAERTRTRRDHEKYLTLIDAIALAAPASAADRDARGPRAGRCRSSG